MSAPIISGEGLCKDFRGLRALDRVDFQVKEGSITAIIGPNGAGKSTLFNLITGDHPPTEGSVQFMGKAITGLSPDMICRMGISRTYQTVRPFPGLSVRDNIRVALLYGRKVPLAPERIEPEIAELLGFVHLDVPQQKKAEELTPLGRKRLELARALATDPRLLLLDEIVAGLSLMETTEMMTTIRALSERGITVLLIEHVMKAVMDLSAHVIVLHHGEKIAEGDPATISKDERVIKAYLGDAALEE